MEGIFFNYCMFLPAIMGGGYLLYRFFRKMIPHKKEQKKDKERQQVWFYNCWLPLVIAALIHGSLWLFSVLFPQMEARIEHAVDIIPISAIMTTGVLYIAFYLLYSFIYWIVRLNGCKVGFDARIFLGNVFVWGIIAFFCLCEAASFF